MRVVCMILAATFELATYEGEGLIIVYIIIIIRISDRRYFYQLIRYIVKSVTFLWIYHVEGFPDLCV